MEGAQAMTMLPIRHRIKPNGSLSFYCVYPSDVGNLHVIDYYLHKENFGTSLARLIFQPADRFSPDDWTRYDGDLL